MKSAYNLSANGGLPQLKKKLLKSLKKGKSYKLRSAYQPGRIPSHAYL